MIPEWSREPADGKLPPPPRVFEPGHKALVWPVWCGRGGRERVGLSGRRLVWGKDRGLGTGGP